MQMALSKTITRLLIKQENNMEVIKDILALWGIFFIVWFFKSWFKNYKEVTKKDDKC